MTDAAIPRRSARVSTDLAVSDGDIWAERITVCETATSRGQPKLSIRSYYRNKRTQQRVWDEPPSGAGTVLHATPEMRQTAELKLQELQLTLEMIPEDDIAHGNNPSDKTKKRGFLNLFRKKQNKEIAEAKDLNLQKAIAQSMADQYGGGDTDPAVYFDSDYFGNEDESYEMAKALSLSEEAATAMNVDAMTEDEMLRRALEESRLDALRNGISDVGSVPEPRFVSLIDMDRKMPYKSYDVYD